MGKAYDGIAAIWRFRIAGADLAAGMTMLGLAVCHPGLSAAQQSLATSTSQEQPFGGTAFDGEYYSEQWKFGFRIHDGIGIATSSNSPKFKAGDVVLRARVTNPQTFLGQMMCTDGGFHPVIGKKQADGGLVLNSPECGQWTMARTAGPSQTVLAPAPSQSAFAGNASLCNHDEISYDRQIAACTRFFDNLQNTPPGSVAKDVIVAAYILRARAYLLRGMTQRRDDDIAAASLDVERAISLNPRQAEGFGIRGAVRDQQGKAQAALDDYDRALAIQPGYPPVQTLKRDLLARMANQPRQPHPDAYADASSGATTYVCRQNPVNTAYISVRPQEPTIRVFYNLATFQCHETVVNGMMGPVSTPTRCNLPVIGPMADQIVWQQTVSWQGATVHWDARVTSPGFLRAAAAGESFASHLDTARKLLTDSFGQTTKCTIAETR